MRLQDTQPEPYRRWVASSAIFRQHAGAYARFSEHSLPNACYDRPAILRLAGDVAGRRVLELGCAAGVLTEQLTGRGADVLGLDREPDMAALARQRLGGRARIEVAVTVEGSNRRISCIHRRYSSRCGRRAASGSMPR
jgi:SAM-dependent methyltransferase